MKAGRTVAAVLCLVLCTGWAGARTQHTYGTGQEDGAEEGRERSRVELVTRLEAYAGWCRGKRAFGEYGKTLELILAFDPSNATALKGLGYRKRGRDWVPPKKPRTFENKDDRVLEQADLRYREAIEPFVSVHTEWVQSDGLSEDERAAALTAILRLDPANPVAVDAPIEVRAAAEGVLPETLDARERRAALRKWVEEGFRGAPESRATELRDREEALGIAWAGALETPAFRVVYTTSAEEADRILLALHATDTLFTSLFPKRRGLPVGLTVFLMHGDADKRAFLANHPAIDDAGRAFLSKVGGSGIDGTRDFAFWEGDEQRRADGIVRMALGWLFKGGFGFSVESGWAYEGFGLSLTRLLVRTRLNWTAQAEPAHAPAEDFKLRTRLLSAETNWMQEAHLMWSSDGVPDFEVLLGKNVNQLSTEDILASYVLAAYLLEGQPEKIDSFLRMTGSRISLEEQVRRVFQWDPATLRDRVGRWLSERR